MENTIYALILLAVTGLTYSFFCWISREKPMIDLDGLRKLPGGKITGKHTNPTREIEVTYKKHKVIFPVSSETYHQIAVGMTLPLQQ
ncbi:MAG TPA: hypothetical protein VJB35_06570 [Candidatus Nanoarchaeia archaeon]|nr:hypothetical protein [Candidatus Nanoarchaeia archaeon]